ncbi:MAG: RDD family protein [Deltaproteobacteria bacterium]|nr:RDD family protein [Deltaproteobacteria bacterium]
MSAAPVLPQPFGKAGDPPRALPTPEGVPLRLELASLGERASAHLLDQFIIQLTSLVLVLCMIFAHLGGDEGKGSSSRGFLLAILTVGLFFARTFYFIVFEAGPRGATPGKRWAKIRVIDRSGGPLTLSQVVTRNVMRDVEFWVPLIVIIAPSALFGPDVPGWAGWVAGAWALLVFLLPWWNKDRLRAGDMVGGTLVVRSPAVLLLDDLGSGTQLRRGQPHVFSSDQLAHYGAFELQTLEAVLRRGNGLLNAEAITTVAESIKKRIGWTTQVTNDFWFLRDFYAAQRAHLEHRLGLGQRRAHKDDKPGK